MSLPKPSTYLTYPSDVTHMVGEVKGPNRMGEYLTAVSVEYDERTGYSRVGFAYGVHRFTIEEADA